jgi:hypothetical protein
MARSTAFLALRIPLADHEALEALAIRRGSEAHTLARRMIRACLEGVREPLTPAELQAARERIAKRKRPRAGQTESEGLAIDVPPEPPTIR